MAAIGIVEQRVGQAGPGTRDAPGCGAGLANLGAAAGPASALTTPSAREPGSKLPVVGLWAQGR